MRNQQQLQADKELWAAKNAIPGQIIQGVQTGQKIGKGAQDYRQAEEQGTRDQERHRGDMAEAAQRQKALELTTARGQKEFDYDFVPSEEGGQDRYTASRDLKSKREGETHEMSQNINRSNLTTAGLQQGQIRTTAANTAEDRQKQILAGKVKALNDDLYTASMMPDTLKDADNQNVRNERKYQLIQEAQRGLDALGVSGGKSAMYAERQSQAAGRQTKSDQASDALTQSTLPGVSEVAERLNAVQRKVPSARNLANAAADYKEAGAWGAKNEEALSRVKMSLAQMGPGYQSKLQELEDSWAFNPSTFETREEKILQMADYAIAQLQQEVDSMSTAVENPILQDLYESTALSVRGLPSSATMGKAANTEDLNQGQGQGGVMPAGGFQGGGRSVRDWQRKQQLQQQPPPPPQQGRTGPAASNQYQRGYRTQG